MLKTICMLLLAVSLVIAVILIVVVIFLPNQQYSINKCEPSITSASGSAAPSNICSGSLIFVENFNGLDKNKWQPEVTLSGGSNGEFQWYVADDENSFAKNGQLHLKPTLSSDKIGRHNVETGYIRLNDCTDFKKTNCERQSDGQTIINPVRSACLTTEKSFSFKYGHVEIIAKLPIGDWLWPAIWLLPTHWKYGDWPRSGEIDLLESHGNLNLTNQYGQQIGVQRVTSELHFGPSWFDDGFKTTTFSKNIATSYANDFHKYAFTWDHNGIRFFIDDDEIGDIPVQNGFWKRGNFNGQNIWSVDDKMAPFDQEFYLIMNLAVGGSYSDMEISNKNRPWNETSPSAMREFWMNRKQWLPTWRLNTDDSSFIIDSVKIWAI